MKFYLLAINIEKILEHKKILLLIMLRLFIFALAKKAPFARTSADKAR
jgi:hypothetical protein